VRLQDLDFDRKQLKVVQGKGKKDRYTTFDSFDTRIKKYIAAEKPIDYLLMVNP
jgi:site-specific recombinase XerD